MKHSLHRGWRDARVFHGSFAAALALAATIVPTLFPRLDMAVTAAAVAAALLVGLALVGPGGWSAKPSFAGTPWARLTWTMPPLETLPRPTMTRSRMTGVIVLRAYLAVAAVALAVKALELIIV